MTVSRVALLLALGAAAHAAEPEGAAPAQAPALTIRILAGRPGPDGAPTPKILVADVPIHDWDHLDRELRSRARPRRGRGRQAPVIVRPSADAKHKWVMRVLDALRKADFQNIRFEKDEPAQPPPAKEHGDEAPRELWIRIRTGEKDAQGKPTPEILVDRTVMKEWDVLAGALILLAKPPEAARAPVIVDPAADVPHGWVTRVLDTLQYAGFEDINLKQEGPVPPVVLAGGPGAPDERPLPPRREHTLITIRRAPGTDKPRARLTLNGVVMDDWKHLRRSLAHLAGEDEEARDRLTVSVQCEPDVPFGWVKAVMQECVGRRLWRLRFELLDRAAAGEGDRRAG